MRIDGKEIAEKILQNLQKEVESLNAKNIIPRLAIILVGNDPASSAYVRQKDLKAARIGAKTTIKSLPSTITQNELFNVIEQFNNDPNIHGIIVQQPLPVQINENEVVKKVNPEKDIDGLHPNSPYPMPLAEAVIEILKEIYLLVHAPTSQVDAQKFIEWLKSKQIVVIGRGETGGKPVSEKLKNLGATPQIITRQTENPQEIIKIGDIIISAVGKRNLINASDVKKEAILIGIGMQKGDDGKLHADYEEEEINDLASFYTPVPGGVGPVNVAMLLKNLIDASKNFGN